MRKAYVGIIILAATVLGLGRSAPAADLPSAEELIARFGAAIGGDALAKVANRSEEFEFEMPGQGVYARGVDYWQAPAQHYMKLDLSSSGVSNYEAGVADGVAWESHPMNGTRQLTGDEERTALRGASLNPLADWKKFFEKAETVSEETVGKRTCYKVVFTPASGAPLTSYLDAETGLLVREEAAGPGGTTVTSDLSDWQETQGIRSARLIEVTGPQPYTMRFTSVAYDVDDLPQKGFALPASLASAADR